MPQKDDHACRRYCAAPPPPPALAGTGPTKVASLTPTRPDLMAYGQFRRPLGEEEGGSCSQTEALARRRKAATRCEYQSEARLEVATRLNM